MGYEWIVDALDETWRTTERALRNRSERSFDQPTACVGWSVRDVVNHLTGTELLLGGESMPLVTSEPPAYVRNALGEVNEAFVATRRHLAATDVLADFRRATAASLARLRSFDDDRWAAPTWTPRGEQPQWQFQESRVVDSWIHLQDIRDALLEPTDDHGAGEQLVLNRFEAALPFVWATRSGAPEGALVQLNLLGRLGRTIRVRVENGRGVGAAPTAQAPTVELTTPVALYWRRCAGRINAEAFLGASATDVQGDRRLAVALAEGLNVTP